MSIIVKYVGTTSGNFTNNTEYSLVSPLIPSGGSVSGAVLSDGEVLKHITVEPSNDWDLVSISDSQCSSIQVYP